jgi:hypothetical protein
MLHYARWTYVETRTLNLCDLGTKDAQALSQNFTEDAERGGGHRIFETVDSLPKRPIIESNGYHIRRDSICQLILIE